MQDSSTQSDTIDPRWGEPDFTHDPYILAHFKARPSDVLITTAPKAGTTWMQQILHQLRTGGDPDFKSIYTVVPWLECPDGDKTWQERLANYEAIPDPRVFKTHCTCEQTPGLDVAKIILTTRDPRDCCVSFYHHLQNMTDEVKARSGIPMPESIEQHVERWLEFAAWFRNVKSWWPVRDQKNVLLLRYEDLKKDLAGGIEQILTFLEWTLTPQQQDKVLEYCSFGWMKTHNDKFTLNETTGEHSFKPGTFIRKGEVGDGKTLLTPELELLILERARQELEPECLTYLQIN